MEPFEVRINRHSITAVTCGFCAGLAWILLIPLAHLVYADQPDLMYVLFNFGIGVGLILIPIAIFKKTYILKLTPLGINETLLPVFGQVNQGPSRERLIPWEVITDYQKGELALPYGHTLPSFNLFAHDRKVLSLRASETRHLDEFVRFATQLELQAHARGLVERPASRGWLRSSLGRFLSLSLLLLTAHLIWLDWTIDISVAWSSKLHLYLILVPFVMWMNIRSFR